MSFVDPVTVTDPITGEHAEATLLNTWRANHEFLNGTKAGCRVRTNTGTALSAGGTAVPFELEDYDNNACHSTSSDTSRITIPSGWDGWWAFGFECRLTANGTFRVCLNGTNTLAGALLVAVTTTSSTVASSGRGAKMARLAAGDYIELFGLTSGSVSVTFNPVFWAQWLAA